MIPIKNQSRNIANLCNAFKMPGNHLNQTNNLVTQQSTKIKSDFSSDLKNRKFVSMLSDTKNTQYFKNAFPQNQDDFGVAYRNLRMDQNIKSKSLYGVQRMGFFSKNKVNNEQFMDFLDIKVDVVFKDFFGDKAHKEILESFVNTILDLQGDDVIEVEDFLDPKKTRVEIGKPTTFVHLSVKTKGGERYIIEMQTYNHEGFDKRLLYYLGKDYTDQVDYLEKREDETNRKIGWRDLPKVHVIALTNFNRTGSKEGLLNSSEVMETYNFQPQNSSDNGHLFDQWKATILDLKKFKCRNLSEVKTDKEKWFFLLKNSKRIRESEMESLKNNPCFKSAVAQLTRLSSDPVKRKEYEQSINEQRDHDAVLSSATLKGIQIGEQIGEEKATKEAIFNMFDLSVPKEKVQEKYLNEDIDALHKEWSLQK